jgi:hypothetical protein
VVLAERLEHHRLAKLDAADANLVELQLGGRDVLEWVDVHRVPLYEVTGVLVGAHGIRATVSRLAKVQAMATFLNHKAHEDHKACCFPL